jgi:GDP-4-dehydro-6-deoxy-D-mannose reductase
MRTLITGISGLAGQHLYDLLSLDDKYEIWGTYHSRKDRGHFSMAHLLKCDLNDIEAVEKTVEACEPDVIFHLGAYVTVHQSFDNPIPIFQTNTMGTLNLLESVRKKSDNSRILISGSAEEYGKVPQSLMPIKENYSLNPVSPYGMSKKFQEEAGLMYHKTYGLDIILTRTFHYAGPYQPLGFVFPDIAKQIVDIERCTQPPSIKVGNLAAKRDFTDIRDVVSAYGAIMEKGKTGEVYNVCTGKSVTISSILEMMIDFSDKDIDVTVDTEKIRPLDIPDFIGDNSKLKRDTGWQQSYSIEDTARDVFDFWYNRKEGI